MKPALVETMTRIELVSPFRLRLVIRIWRQTDTTPPIDNLGRTGPGNYDLVQMAWKRFELDDSAEDIGEKLLEMDRVNSVEITGPYGHGFVLYKEWP